ncbi:MAG: 50S ribosomal protein L29 [Elusimicrobiota bacterium]|jgi:large subunit ribosomal protein L29|nr:50S ribosomal protein L29 [Elusimicrobiota bacterium]
MNLVEIREMSKIELIAKIEELKEKKFRLTFKHKTTVLKNTMDIRNIRKDIARINTILNEKNMNKH